MKCVLKLCDILYNQCEKGTHECRVRHPGVDKHFWPCPRPRYMYTDIFLSGVQEQYFYP